MPEITDEIRARVNIVDLVGQRVALKRAGKDWKGLCPFHDDKNPSFQVSPTMGRYRCWSCGEKGDVFNWVMKTQNIEFVDALKQLATLAGVELPKRGHEPPKSQKQAWDAAMASALHFFRSQLNASKQVLEYCERRGLDAEVRDQWQIGYAPDEGSALATHLRKSGHSLSECKALFLVDEDVSGGYFDKFRGRLMFPIRDEKGELVAFGGRILGDGQPKYINSSDTPLYRKSKVLYGMDRAKETISKERKAVLSEGYLDTIACHRAGVTGAVASLGTSLAEDHARLLKRWGDGVTIFYDSDAAGLKAAERAIEVLATAGLKVRVALMEEGQDPDTLLAAKGAEAVRGAVAAGLKPIDFRLEQLKRRLDPKDDDFWTEAISIIASSPTEREMELHLMKLAAIHPLLKDPVAAQARLRSDAMAIRTPSAKRRTAPTGSGTKSSMTHPLSAAERVLFLAFLGIPLRERAWQALHEDDLLETLPASELAASIVTAFSQPPEGEPSVWLHRLADDSHEQVLVELHLDPRTEPLSGRFLDESIEFLRKKRASRQLRVIKKGDLDDSAKTAYLEGVRKLHQNNE